MSIERHLASHAQEPGRLHDITIETQERPKIWFDPQRDLLPSDWESLHTTLDYDRSRSNWLIFSRLASHMKLLSAERIEITKDGLKLTMPSESFVQPSKSRPERKAV